MLDLFGFLPFTLQVPNKQTDLLVQLIAELQCLARQVSALVLLFGAASQVKRQPKPRSLFGGGGSGGLS